jgi:uncharacterized membrane protein YccC
MPALGRNEFLFAAKTYLAALLALWIALSLDLPKPYWAMGTVYIVVHPLAGAVTSKALYRVLGTLIGAIATLVLVPNLVDAPELLCLALALWVGTCLFISLLDRTPRSYVFMLSGYTAAIIGFSAVTAPETIFDTALARVEEITLGILCSAIVSRVVFPRHVGPIIAARVDGWLTDAGRWAQDVLLLRAEDDAADQDRRRLAADTVELVGLTTHLAYDTSRYRHATEQMRVLQQHMTALLPILSALRDRLSALSPSPDVRAVLADIASWIASGLEGSDHEAESLRLRVAALEPSDVQGWDGMILSSLCVRLRDLIDVWSDCLMLRREIATGRDRMPDHLRMHARYAGAPSLHRDVGMALLSGGAAALGTLVCCAFWIATGWHDGGVAAQMGAVFCSIFAFMDNPVPMLKKFTVFLCVAVGLVTVYQFAILPMVDGFSGLALVLAPTMLISGAFMGSAAWMLPGFTVSANMPMMLGLQSHLSMDFASFINNCIATIIGVLAATAVTATIRSIGAAQSARRLLRAGQLDVARVAERDDPTDVQALIRRVVDRLGLLVPRLATSGDTSLRSGDVLADLRTGINIAELQRLRRLLGDEDCRQQLSRLLAKLGQHFREASPMVAADTSLLPAIDAAIDATIATRQAELRRDVLHALIGIRRAMFPQAPSYEQALPAPISEHVPRAA